MSRPLIILLLLFALLSGVSCKPKRTEAGNQLRRETRTALQDHSYTKAAELAGRWVGASPHDERSWAGLVRAQLGGGDVASAQQTLGEWRAIIHKPSPRWDELAGDVAFQQGDPPLAFQSWQRALKRKPKNLRVLQKVARAHRRLDQAQEEDAALSKIFALTDNGSTRMERALCRRRLRRWPEALEDCRRAQKLAPQDPDVRRGAKLFERLGKFLTQIRELDAHLALTPEDDQLLADRALLFLRSEDYELGAIDSQAAAQKGPWAMRPRLFRALAAIGLGRANESTALGVDPRLRLSALSAEFLETMSRLDSEISLERSNPELHISRAWQLNEIGQPTLALEDAESALGQEEKSAGAHAEKSYALTKLGRAEEALAEIKRATELDPNFSAAWHYRGELEMTREDFAAAIESLSRSLALTENTTALQKREQCYMKTGQFQKAEEDHRALESLKARGL